MSAIFSKDRKFRYALWRDLDCHKKKPTCCFIMLNPSTADEIKNDPTVSRCINFAISKNCGRLIVTNIFALRSTDPRILYDHGKKAIGKENNKYILKAAKTSDLVVCAWGNHGRLLDRGQQVLGLLRKHKIRIFALGLNKKTQAPSHPLFLPAPLELHKL